MMDSSEHLFISEWRLAFIQNKLFLDIFIYVFRQEVSHPASYALVVDLEITELCECPGVPH